MTISPIEVERRTRFHDSVEAVVVAAGTDATAVIPGVTDMVPVFDSILTEDAGCWVHPTARRKVATSTHTSSPVRTGDDMIKLVGMIRK
jgi:hypothetical protein